MAWMCPTFQRPHRLKELAETWVEMAEDIPLYVRIWKHDQYKEKYYETSWPEEFHLYESEAEWAGDALRDYFVSFPSEPFYGFIGDDVLLKTPDGVAALINEAQDFFIAYPNDRIQRHHLCTHFCLGGELVRTVGYLVPPGIRHHYMDNIWMTIGLNTGLLRYRPDIIFSHAHFLRGREYDDTYEKVYLPDGSMKPEAESYGKTIFDLWMKKRAQEDIISVRRRLLELCEGRSYTDKEVRNVVRQQEQGVMMHNSGGVS